MEDEVQVQSNPEVVAGPGFITNFVNIFVNPHKTFIALDRKPSWLIPVIIMTLLTLTLTYLTFPIIMQNQMENIRNNPNIPADRLEAIEQQMAEAGNAQMYIGVGTQLIVIPIVYLILAGIFFFVGSVLLGGNAPFVKVLAVYAWSSLIGIIGIIVKTPLVFIKEKINVPISPALILPGDAVDSVLYRILSQFDFFTIWQLAVFAYGFSIVYRFSTGKAFTTVGVLWAIWIVIVVVGWNLFKGFGMM